MRFRHLACALSLTAWLFAPAREAQAADCISERVDYDKRGHQIAALSLVEDADARQVCGSLGIRVRARNDPRPNVNVFATYPEFENPRHPAEQRYNEWIGGVVATMDFDRAIVLSRSEKVEDVVVVTSLYRSGRLISAAYDRWLCCGTPGVSTGGSINIDAASGMLVSPQDLFDLSAVADRCWQQFATPTGPTDRQGDLFREDYPMGRPFSRTDFEDDAVDAPASGPLAPSVARTVRLFRATLRRSSNWIFSERGAAIEFGMLLGYAGTAFDCLLDRDALKPMAQPGVSVPP